MPRVRTAAVGVKICKNLPRETTEVENPVLIDSKKQPKQSIYAYYVHVLDLVNLRSSSRSPCDVPAAAPAPAAAHNPGISHDSMEPWWSEVHAAAH